MLWQATFHVKVLPPNKTPVQRHTRKIKPFDTFQIKHGSFVRFRHCAVIRPMETGPCIMLPATEEEREMLFHRMNKAFIHRFIPGFRQKDLPLLYYLRTNADDLHCQINALRITDLEETIDFTLVDFLGEHLRPQTLETLMFREPCGDYAKLFAHGALRCRVVLLVYEVSHCPPNEDKASGQPKAIQLLPFNSVSFAFCRCEIVLLNYRLSHYSS